MKKIRIVAMVLAVLAMPILLGQTYAADITDDAIHLASSGVSDEVVIAWAEQQHIAPLSASDIIRMKDAKVSETVIIELIHAANAPRAAYQAPMMQRAAPPARASVQYADQRTGYAEQPVQYADQPVPQYSNQPVQYANQPTQYVDSAPCAAPTVVYESSPAVTYVQSGYPYDYGYYGGYPYYGSALSFNFGFGGYGCYGYGGYGHGGYGGGGFGHGGGGFGGGHGGHR